ncbi:MAG: nucleotide-diphospho-sugar transferase [bacterium]
MNQTTVPILFIIFNRPEKTQRVFDAIRKARPTRLFISADGPREGRIGEKELCEKARAIVKNVDWPCDVKTRFQEKNLGCKINASSSVTWMFQHVEEGIILEDDCLPTQSFFPYCAELLEKYRDTPEVMHVNSTSFLPREETGNPSLSYHFSRCPQLWGWATWRRAWQQYDIQMTHLDTLQKTSGTEKLFSNKKYLKFWIKHCKHIRKKNVDTWDAQWQYTLLYKGGCVITPHFNLIENIGFGPDATHTKDSAHNTEPVSEIDSPLRHPTSIIIDQKADARLIEKMYMKSLWEKIISRLQ